MIQQRSNQLNNLAAIILVVLMLTLAYCLVEVFSAIDMTGNYNSIFTNVDWVTTSIAGLTK